MKFKIKNLKLKIVLLVTGYWLLVTLLTGCEAFVRKFTRKPKKPEIVEEPILVPEEYPEPNYSTHEIYKDSYLFFRNWVDELINYLEPSENRKKQLDCIKEIKENLSKMHSVLKEPKQRELAIYIKDFEDIENKIKGYLTPDRFYSLKNQCMNLKTKISKNFSYSKVKEFIR